ncbi:MAG: glycosyltransferase family 9 protein [Desulfobacterales bacterium]|jgi:ADP-heptose:LPS heptosyltransferase
MPTNHNDPSTTSVPATSSAATTLVVHTGALGDVVLTFPILAQLRAQGHTVDLLCQGKIGALAASLALIHHSYDLEVSWSAALFARPPAPEISRWLRGYATLLIFSRAPELARLKLVLRAVQVICLPPRPPVGQRIHVTRYLWNELRHQGLDLPPLASKLEGVPGVGIAEDPGQKGASLPKNMINLLALHPGSGSPRKNLPLSHWIEVAALLMARGDTPVWVLGPAESQLQEELAARGPKGQQFWLIGDLVALSANLKGARGFMGHDSGLSHLAAFLGLPVLAVFGPSDPRRWQPWGARVKVLRAPLECRPCFETETANCAEDICRRALTAQKIVAAWDDWAASGKA